MPGDHGYVSGLRRVDLARATGCNLETIRYYEKIGVMPSPPRSTNGYRVYDGRHVSRLGFVMRARDLGFTLEEVRSLLTLVDQGAQTCAEVQLMAQEHLGNVRSKIDDLQRIEAVLSETVAKCSGADVPECAVIDALAPG
jgi:MerR family transcriptional regulator, mercuric resistance operon regulatory protein